MMLFCRCTIVAIHDIHKKPERKTNVMQNASECIIVSHLPGILAEIRRRVLVLLVVFEKKLPDCGSGEVLQTSRSWKLVPINCFFSITGYIQSTIQTSIVYVDSSILPNNPLLTITAISA